jgi:L-arabinonolactonase
MIATCRVDCRNTLGEGCVWDPRDECVYWTDIEASRIFCLNPDGSVDTFPVPERVAFILPRQAPGFIIGFASRIAVADSSFETFTTIAIIEPELPQTRVNDAAVDPFGGVVFGTFDERDRKPVASLYRLAPDLELSRLEGDITISNGIAFAPDGGTMYFADTPVGVIRRLRIHGDFSRLEEIEPLAGADIAPGKPDGAVMDEEGHYWNARVWGGCLVRIAPDGRVSDLVELPTKGPTCVALGGDAGNRLFATTLRLRHSEQELAVSPQAGGLFEVPVHVAGVPQRLCSL